MEFHPTLWRAHNCLETGPNGQSYVVGINIYAQKMFMTDVRYVYTTVDDEYATTVIIDDLTYVTVTNLNKKISKLMAARATAEILMPEFREHYPLPLIKRPHDKYNLQFFDKVNIGNKRIPDYCAEMGELDPFKILITCLSRNFGYTESDVKIRVLTDEAQLSMSVGFHSVSVPMNELSKQRAAYAILVEIHPHFVVWGSIIRMYVVHNALDCAQLRRALARSPDDPEYPDEGYDDDNKSDTGMDVYGSNQTPNETDTEELDDEEEEEDEDDKEDYKPNGDDNNVSSNEGIHDCGAIDELNRGTFGDCCDIWADCRSEFIDDYNNNISGFQDGYGSYFQPDQERGQADGTEVELIQIERNYEEDMEQEEENGGAQDCIIDEGTAKQEDDDDEEFKTVLYDSQPLLSGSVINSCIMNAVLSSFRDLKLERGSESELNRLDEDTEESLFPKSVRRFKMKYLGDSLDGKKPERHN